MEQKVDLSFHVKDCFGTADMVIVTDKKVHIIDLKLGKGVQVDAENNTQLMIYGLGMLDIAEMLFDIETVELTIVQPRISHFSTWEISAEELHQWAEQEFEPKARMALDGEGEYKAGEWCRFCKARFQCRARAEEYLHLAQMEFSQPALLSDEEIAEVLSKADALKKWAEEIYTYAQNEKQSRIEKNGRDSNLCLEEATGNIPMKRKWRKLQRQRAIPIFTGRVLSALQKWKS